MGPGALSLPKFKYLNVIYQTNILFLKCSILLLKEYNFITTWKARFNLETSDCSGWDVEWWWAELGPRPQLPRSLLPSHPWLHTTLCSSTCTPGCLSKLPSPMLHPIGWMTYWLHPGPRVLLPDNKSEEACTGPGISLDPQEGSLRILGPQSVSRKEVKSWVGMSLWPCGYICSWRSARERLFKVWEPGTRAGSSCLDLRPVSRCTYMYETDTTPVLFPSFGPQSHLCL